MPSAKELMQQRKAAKEAIKGRVPIVRVLLALGFFIIFAILSIASLGRNSGLSLPFMLACTGGTFILYLFFAIRYKKSKTSEEEKKKASLKHAIGSLVFMILLIGVIFFGLVFFIWLSSTYEFMTVSATVQGRLAGIMITSLVVFFSSAPFIMALWYKTAPGVAVKLIVRVFKAFNWKTKDKACEIMVLHSVQEHSFYITLKRAFTALIFSLTVVFTIWTNLLRIFAPFLKKGFGLELVVYAPFYTIDNENFINYCTSLMLNIVLPLVLSFVLFYWALPSTYLLDDAGLVYYKKYLNRRQPAEIRTVSEWFFSIIKAVLGTSAVFAYGWFIWDSRYVVRDVFLAVNLVAAIQFSVFLIGFPLIGTVLMAYILQLFQESQYNKLKTALFQELVNAKIDPRVVQVKFERKDELQERTLIDYTGENFFHNPPLKESTSKFPPPGEFTIKDMLKK
jgi:hypothetical protein